MPTQTQQPMYDVTKTYFENADDGPFGDFAKPGTFQNQGDPQNDFLGLPVYLPFGMGAGPLPSARHTNAAFSRGYDIVTFKNVRTHIYPCHPAPNIFPVSDPGNFDPDKTDNPITTATGYTDPLSIVNSFGIPSLEPEVWQPAMREAVASAGKGQVLVAGFQGTARNDGPEAFVQDHVDGVNLILETGAKVIEINLSCPNEGSPQLLCFNPSDTYDVVKSVRENTSGYKLIVKIAYFSDKALLEDFVKRIGPLVDAINTNNTIATRALNPAGEQAFAGGPARSKPGLSGHLIKQPTLEMVTQLKELRQKFNHSFSIIGLGGVLAPQDYHDLRAAGADAVESVTGAMWNPDLAIDIKHAGI